MRLWSLHIPVALTFKVVHSMHRSHVYIYIYIYIFFFRTRKNYFHVHHYETGFIGTGSVFTVRYEQDL
jgi:hypothetical protein